MRRFHFAWLGILTVLMLLTGATPARSQIGSQYDPWPAAQLTLPAGTWISVRVNEPLSSNHSYAGDTFTATLTQPLIVDGFVIARRGQMIAGQVADVVKAGRTKGTSSLGLELVEITLADGQQLPVETQWIEYEGPTSVGSDVATVATVTGIGAAIGAAADGGFGAGMGALAGAAASTIGVLATRGKDVEIGPESTLTFRTLAPVSFSTAQSAHAFLPVTQADYNQRVLARRVSTRRVYAAPPIPYFFQYRYRPRRFYRPGVVIYSPRPHYIYAPRVVVPRRVFVPRPVVVPRFRPKVVVRPNPRPNRGGDNRDRGRNDRNDRGRSRRGR